MYKSVHKIDHYLQRRGDGKSDKLYVVYPIPPDLHQHLGKRYDRTSSGTSNRADARRFAAEHIASLERKFAVMRAKLFSMSSELGPVARPIVLLPLENDVISSLCEQWRITHLHADDKEREVNEGLDSADIEDIETYAKAVSLDARAIIAQGRQASSFLHVSEEALDWANTLGFRIDESDPLFIKYIRQFAAEKSVVSDILSGRNNGNSILTPSFPAANDGKSLEEYQGQWLSQHIGGLEDKTKSLYAGRVNQFARFLSERHPALHNAPMRTIKGKHIQGFVNFLMHEEGLHPRSIRDGHLPALKSIFKFGLADGELDTNPTTNVVLSKISKKDEAGRSKPRYPFGSENLNLLFSSSWYGDMTDGLLHSPIYADLPTRYWVPLILLSHGLRPIEVCQLRLSDVHYVEGLLCFKVAEEEPVKQESDGNKKKKNSIKAKTFETRRGLPVHSKLLELGFEQFILKRQKQGRPDDRIFPVLEGRPDPAKWFTQVFNRYIRGHLHMPETCTSHSFRHTWEDNRRTAMSEYGKDRWPKGMHFQLSGRADIEREEGSAKDYGVKYTALEMQPYLALIWDKRIKMPSSFPKFERAAFVPPIAALALKDFQQN